MRTARVGLITLAMAVSVALPARSQTYPGMSEPGFELRPFAGAYIPMGGLKNTFEKAPMIGAEAAYEVRPSLHVVASLGWVNTRTDYVATSRRVNIWQYDAGAEMSLVRPAGLGWVVKPFLGLGAGARTYDYTSSALEGATCTAGYGAAGSEFQYSLLALRLEARDYVHCFRSPLGGKRTTRNDVGLSLGIAYHFR